MATLTIVMRIIIEYLLDLLRLVSNPLHMKIYYKSKIKSNQLLNGWMNIALDNRIM